MFLFSNLVQSSLQLRFVHFERGLPQEVIQGAWTWGWLSVDLVISSVPADRVLPETQEPLFVAQHAAVIGVADVIRVCQPLYVVIVVT